MLNIRKSKIDLQYDLGILNGYLKRKKISRNLSVRIQKHLEYTKEGEKSMNCSEENKIINKLSFNLIEELYGEANGKVINEIPFFTKNFSKGFCIYI